MHFPVLGALCLACRNAKSTQLPSSNQAFILRATKWRVPTLSLDFHLCVELRAVNLAFPSINIPLSLPCCPPTELGSKWQDPPDKCPLLLSASFADPWAIAFTLTQAGSILLPGTFPCHPCAPHTSREVYTERIIRPETLTQGTRPPPKQTCSSVPPSSSSRGPERAPCTVALGTNHHPSQTPSNAAPPSLPAGTKEHL